MLSSSGQRKGDRDMQQGETKDLVRGNSERVVTIHWDPEDLVLLPCHTSYDPALEKQVRVPRRVEWLDGEEWKPYPVVAWHDGVFSDLQLQTVAIIVKTNESGVHIMASADGVPDGVLMLVAEQAGIYVETYDG